MKSPQHRSNEALLEHREAILAKHVSELFRRLPALAGFWLGPDLEVHELSIFTWPGRTVGRDTYEELMRSLVDLAEERPETLQLMRGRTFARVVH